MIEIAVPGHRNFSIKHIVLDYNGTLACDGIPVEGVAEALNSLSDRLQIHVITADTFGEARFRLQDVKCEILILPKENQDEGKLEYVKRLGSESSACIGNGRNDRLMLKEAALGIAVILDEGTAVETLLAADIVCTGIVNALELFSNPLRLVATLRS
jgi:soluble P-type ATPase